MKISLSFLILLWSYSIGMAQVCNIENDLIEITRLIEIGNFDEGIQKSRSLLSCPNTTAFQKCLLQISQYKALRNKGKYKEAGTALNKALAILKTNNLPIDTEFQFLLAEKNGFLAQPDEFNKNIRPIEELMSSPTNQDDLFSGRYYLATYRVTNKDAKLYEAINHLQTALLHFEKLPTPPVFYYNNTLRSLGNMYRNASDFDKSIFYYKKGKTFISKHYPTDHYEVAYYNYTIGAVYYHKLEYQKALDHFLEARKVWVNYLEPSESYMRYLNEAIGDMYWELNDPENALTYFNYSVLDETKVNNDTSEKAIKEADSLIEIGDYSKALSFYEQAFKWREKEYGKNNVQTGACKNFVARAIGFSGDTEGALVAYQEAISILVPEMNNTSWQFNPTPEMKVQSYQYLLESLIAKGELLKELYSKSNKITDLETALQTQEVAIVMLENLKDRQLSDGSREFWTERTLSLIESSIETALRLHTLTTEEVYLERAFNYSERSKALLLLSSLNDQNILAFANVSEAIISEENVLKKSINEYTGMIESEEKRCADVRGKMLSLWRSKLNAIQNQYDLLILKIQIEHPEYYALKYNHEISDVDIFQNELLDKNTGLISYFTGNKNTYIFLLTEDTIHWRMVEDTKRLFEQITSLFNNLGTQTNSINDPQLAFNSFTEEAYSLYTKLIEPELIHSDITNLIIIPDGKLCYLPFESLLTSKTNRKQRDYPSLPYLLNKVAISYSPSATTRLLVQKSEKINYEYIGFAPNYSEQEYTPTYRTGKSLGNLQFNIQEVEQASKLFSGTSWTGKSVSEDLLKNASSGAGILHLAMHGEVEDEHPLLSKLYFNSSEENDGMLHIYEIYNMHIPAQLVILSACNTASGKLIRGEGIQSLERAFQYAGSKALLSTLWTVDDESSLKLVAYFLTNIKSGKPKDIALQEAKQKYLATAPPEKLHPFYWSSFRLTGNTKPLIRNSNSIYIYTGLGIAGVFIGIFLYKRSQRKEAA